MRGSCDKSGLGDETEESGTSKTGPRKGLEREEIRGSKASPVSVLPNEQRHIGQNEKLRKAEVAKPWQRERSRMREE